MTTGLKTIFLIFLRLGLTSFGGPIAHLGYFREEFVVRRRWLSEEGYADLVALCQFLPGPASSQVGIGIGLSRGGIPGAIAAWSGFTLPSALALIAFALGLNALGDTAGSGWLYGLKVAAVAVVAQAVLGMLEKLCPDWPRRLIMVAAALIALAVSGIVGQLSALVVAALIGLKFACKKDSKDSTALHLAVNKSISTGAILLFLGLLGVLPLFAGLTGNNGIALFDSFYRSGALVFGGGHVVLPLLQAEVVIPGWISEDLFLAGYGAAQAVPGPLFTLSAFLGAAMTAGPGGISGGLWCLLAMFLPSFLLVIGILPFWDGLRRNQLVRKLLYGINAGVVGLLAAALIYPVFTTAIHGVVGLLLAGVAFWLLVYRKLPAWLVVLVCGLVGQVVL